MGKSEVPQQGVPAPGRVYLVGAGPGDAELLTLKAARLLARADVVLYDRLVGPGILDLCRPDVERLFVGKRRDRHQMRQIEIHEAMINRARAGQLVVRLKGGDPLIFGRGGEEIEALLEAGIAVEVVPGVTAAAGCAAEALIPLTHRDHAQTLVIATGHTRDGEPALDWQALCKPRQTLVFYMAHHALPGLCARLVEHGLPADLPACLIENGTLSGTRRIQGTLTTLPDRVAAVILEGPALLIVGSVAGLGVAREGKVAAASVTSLSSE